MRDDAQEVLAQEVSPQGGAAVPSGGFGAGFLRDLWYFAALSSELRPGRLQRFEILGEPVLIGRARAGGVFALRDICPHRAAPLSAGQLLEAAGQAPQVQCPYHGWSFRTSDGVCASIPSLVEGQDLDPSKIRVRRYPARESQGMVFIYMAADPRALGEPASEPPTFGEIPGGAPKIVERMDFESHLDQAVVGLMDPTHGPYVHQQWWWRSKRGQLVKAKAFAPREQGFAMTTHAPSKNSRAYRLLGGAPQTEITFRLPGYRWERVSAGPRSVLALTCLTPLSNERTRITQIMWSDHPAFTLLRPIIRVGVKAFLRQDGTMVNLQKEGLKYGPRMLFIDDADRQAKWYQALKRAWAAHVEEDRPFINPVEPAVLRWRS
jgi:phenylpropionate dioxygenase-like ring-hydroxylating dioxygenase large terminal subunit